MDLGGQHILLIVIGVFFSYKTIGIWLAKSIESFRVERRLKKERARRERDQKNREKELDKELSRRRRRRRLESVTAGLKSELGGIIPKEYLINASKIILLFLLIVAIFAPLILDTVGNLYTIPGYEWLVGSQDGVGEWILSRLILGSIILLAIAYISNEEGKQINTWRDYGNIGGGYGVGVVLGVIMLAAAVWIFFFLWAHQLWNRSEQWWLVFLGIIITGLISNWDRLQSENPP